MVNAQKPHQAVTSEDLKRRVHWQRPRRTSAQQVLFKKTLSLYCAYRIQGCLGPVDETVQVNREDEQDEWVVQTQKSRQGHDAKLTCNGRLIFDYDYYGKAFVR
jgi:hypothetical protein